MEQEYKNIDRIKELFMAGIDCSQVVAGAFAKETGYSREELWKMSSCFGGGMGCGETCGAVTGALMVLGLIYGYSNEGDEATKTRLMAKRDEFKARLAQNYKGTLCRDILGHDISLPGEFEKVLEEGTMFSLCPCLVRDVIEILEELI